MLEKMLGGIIAEKTIDFLVENAPLDFRIADITKSVGVSRSKVYPVLQHLKREGLIKETRTAYKDKCYAIADNSVTAYLRQAIVEYQAKNI